MTTSLKSRINALLAAIFELDLKSALRYLTNSEPLTPNILPWYHFW